MTDIVERLRMRRRMKLSLRQYVQELEKERDRQEVLVKVDTIADVNHFRKALAESQAREAKLREALECAVDIIGRFLSDEGWLQEDMDNADWIGWVLIQPQDDSALKEVLKQARKDALLEATDIARASEGDIDLVIWRLNKLAEEQK